MTQLNPNWMQAPAYSARLDRQVIKALRTEGVLSGAKVTQRASGGTAMFVDVAAGTGIIYGDDQTDQGAYLATCTVLETPAITAAPGSGARWDLVVWSINDPGAGGRAGSTSTFDVVAGTPGGSPSLPACPVSAIPIAKVVVASGTTQITNAMITDLRVPSFDPAGLPPGVPVPFYGPEAMMPAGHVLYNGQAVNRDTCWRIFYYLGTTHGAGDGSTTFNVPDLRGRAPFGLDNMGGSDAGRLAAANTLGGSGGEELHQLTTNEMPVHLHVNTLTDPGHHHGPGGGFNNFLSDYSGAPYINLGQNGSLTALSASHYGTTADSSSYLTYTNVNAGGDAYHNNMPPYLLCNWIARY